MNMKKLNRLLTGAVLLWLASCSEGMLDEAAQSGIQMPEDNGTAERRTVELQIQNKLQVSESSATRTDAPIATTDENEITAMDIYVFGSETEHGIYTFQERLTYRARQEETAPKGATSFILVTNGTDNKLSTARLSLKKGLYVKLYCVANSPELYVLDEQEKKYVPAVFQPLVTQKTENGVQVTAPGIPTEKNFLAECTARCLDQSNPEDVLHTPLLMRGAVSGSLNLTDYYDNSRLNTYMKLTRGVARFDVHNVAKDSHLTITGVGMSEGNATTALFPFDARPAADGSLITYPWKYFPGGESEAINTGTQTGAFYSYAAPQKASLLLQGDFTTPAGEVLPVNYRVPFRSMKDGNGNLFTIQPNHRYTVTVNKADSHEIKLSIIVADWDEGGNIDDFKPDEEEAGGMSELSTSSVTNIYDSYVYDNKSLIWVAMYTNTAREKFQVKLSSNSDIGCKMKFGDTDTANKWLDMKCTKAAAPAGGTWSTDYTYTFSVNSQSVDANKADKSFPPVTISFVSASGVTRIVQVESLTYTLDGKTLQNSNSYNDNEYWYFDQGSGTWDVAMAACPEDQGWYLLSMNDFRNMFRIDSWNSLELPFGSQPYNNTFNQTSEKNVSNSYLNLFFTGYSYPSSPYMRCNSESDYRQPSKYNYYDNNYNYFWSSDAYDANTARSIQLRAQTYAYTGCSRRRHYYGDDYDSWYYEYYNTHGTGLNNSYLTYRTDSKNSSRRIRCVKRRPNHQVYPF